MLHKNLLNYYTYCTISSCKANKNKTTHQIIQQEFIGIENELIEVLQHQCYQSVFL